MGKLDERSWVYRAELITSKLSEQTVILMIHYIGSVTCC